MSRNLAEWLDYQQLVHVRGIDLGLERVRAVWSKLGAPPTAGTVISVGGTNGKGSTVAFLEAMLRASGHRVGCYTSPHLLNYNERIRVEGEDATDAQLIAAFERIEQARGAVSLTYFEFATLAALLIFSESRLDVAVLEVGLGGRLDAVNLIDADAAIVTTIDLDHQDWLGNDRDAIGGEKAGIFRCGKPAVIGELAPPRGLLEAATASGADVQRAGLDYAWNRGSASWQWGCAGAGLILPYPSLRANCQLANASAAIAVLHMLRSRLGWNPTALAEGVSKANVAARLQCFRAGAVDLIVDVAHNPQAALSLADWLTSNSASGATVAVFSALGDKDIVAIVDVLAESVDAWHLAGLIDEAPRGLPADAIFQRVTSRIPVDHCSMHSGVRDALMQAMAQAKAGDRVVAFGSFFVAAAALRWAAEFGFATDEPMPASTQV